MCSENHVTLRPLHGFNSFTAIHETANDLLPIHKNITIFYLGDHDPHGYAIEEDVKDRLHRMFGLLEHSAKKYSIDFRPRLGLLPEDIGKFGILPLDVEALEKGGKNFKVKRDEFIAKYGNAAAEVDGLPTEVMIDRVQAAFDTCVEDREAWDKVDELTAIDRQEIQARLDPDEALTC